MTITTIPFRELQRGQYPKDSVAHLVDKKSGKSKGLFIPPSLEEGVLKILKKQQENKKQKRFKALESICGIATGMIGNIDHKEIKAKKLEEKYGK